MSAKQSHTRPYAHCEYGEGYVVFDSQDGRKEVWRRSDDYTEAEALRVDPEARPISRQISASASAAEAYATQSSTRGHFRPWAILRPPQMTRAFRLSYPVLGVASLTSIYLWDVRTGAFIQILDQVQDGFVLGDINYIEVGEKYVFLCGTESLRGFSREDGRCVMNLWPEYPLGSWSFTSYGPQSEPIARLVPRQISRRAVSRTEVTRESFDHFIAGKLSNIRWQHYSHPYSSYLTMRFASGCAPTVLKTYHYSQLPTRFEKRRRCNTRLGLGGPARVVFFRA